MALKDVTVKQAKPKEKPYKLGDAGGLYLLVNPNGSKYWRLKYRVAGKEKLLAIGVYPEITLAEARDHRDQARKLLRQGEDPSKVKKRAKAQKRIQVENTFEVIAREWHAQKLESWSPDHAHRVLKTMEKDIFPDLGGRPIAEIEPSEILEVLRKVERRDALDVAGRVLQYCKVIYQYAIQTERAKVNPAAELTGTLKTRKVTHRPALPRAELPEFLVKLDNYDGEPETRSALNLLILTFLRPGELRGARWEEFELDNQLWRVPAKRMKMSEEHLVPLSRQATAILNKLEPLTGRREMLFPNRNRPSQPMSENTMTYALYRMGYKSRATAHGFRATASTILNEEGFEADVIERQLAHVERNKVRAAYHRAEYLDKRRKMMQWWADFIDTERAKGRSENVIELSRNTQT